MMNDVVSLIVANTVSGTAVVALAFGAARLRDRLRARDERRAVLRARANHLQILRRELDLLVAFTEQCELASGALEQFAAYQHWLGANGLLSWRQNRFIVQTWQQTTGSAASIRLGAVAISKEDITDLASDMRKTEFPTPEDEDFRWNPGPGE